MVGKIAPWALIGALDIVIISLIGILVFQIPFRGSALLLALASLLYVICTLGLGLIVSARATSVDSANQLAALISFLPTFMLSGFVFPLTSMPWCCRRSRTSSRRATSWSSPARSSSRAAA